MTETKILNQFVCCFRYFSENWMRAFLWPNVKRGRQCGFIKTYLKIPDIFILVLIAHADAVVFIFFLIPFAVILLGTTVRTIKLSESFKRIFGFSIAFSVL